MMELYNSDFDENLAAFLGAVSNASDLDILELPTNRFIARIEDSVAGQWKGKLSQLGTEPLLLLDIGYPGVVLLVI